MTDNTQPEALRLADWLDGCGGLTSKSAAAELRRQHTLIAELNDRVAKGFDAADMATANAQGFRDGAASVAATAGSEPVAWRYVDARGHFRYVGYKPSRDMSAEYPLLKPIRLYLHPSPPEGMVGGWIASKDQMPPPGVRVFWGDADSNRVGYDSWAGEDFIWTPSHWMPIPPFKAPPTSAEGVEHG